MSVRSTATAPEAPNFGVQARSLISDSTAWLSENALQIVLGITAAAVIVVVLIGARRIGVRLCRSDTAGTHWRTIFGRMLAKTSTWFMIIVAAELVAGYMAPPEAVRSTIHFLFVIAVALQAAVWGRELIMGVIEHRAGGPDPQGALGSALGIIHLLVTVTLFAIAALMILGNLGVDVTGLVAGLGIGGIAIALAAQGIFADLFAALSILFDKPFRRGDVIKWDDTIGTVEAIGLKSTRVRALTGEEIVISNTELLGKEVRNMVGLDYGRTVMTLTLTYESPAKRLARVPGIMREIVEAEENCALVRCGLQGFGDWSVDFILEYDVHSQSWDEVFDARHRINIAILDRLAREKLPFAYPTEIGYVANPDGTVVAPYPEVQLIERIDDDDSETASDNDEAAALSDQGEPA